MSERSRQFDWDAWVERRHYLEEKGFFRDMRENPWEDEEADEEEYAEEEYNCYDECDSV